uniref:Uncharacterized protein n=1 Tax=Mycena chlorophos TaxID=658473 RepID=A0ABQ0KVH5_MYCCL|nr:predicted protein [Mycena chlorophos]
MHVSSYGRSRWRRLPSSESPSRLVKSTLPQEENELPNVNIDEVSPSGISPASTRRTAKLHVPSSPRKPDRPHTMEAGPTEHETIYAGLDLGSSVPSVSRTIRNEHKILDTIERDERYVDKVKLKKMLDNEKGVDWEERRKHRRKAKPIGPPRKRARVSKATPADPETCENDETSSAPSSREASVVPPKKSLRPLPKRPVVSPDVDESDEAIHSEHTPEEFAGSKTVLQPPKSNATSKKDKNAWLPVSVGAQIADNNAVLAVPQDRAELKANTNHARGDPHSVAEREGPKPVLMAMHASRLPPPGRLGYVNPTVAGSIASKPTSEVFEKKEPQQEKSDWLPIHIPVPAAVTVPDAPPAFAPFALPRGPNTELPDMDGPAQLTNFLASLEIDLSRHIHLFLTNDITCVADLAQYCGFREANLTRRMKEMFFDPFHYADSEGRNLKRKRISESEAGFEWAGFGDVGGAPRDDCKGLKQAEIYALIHGIGVLKQRRLEEHNAFPATKY